jgi:hypothetical protein
MAKKEFLELALRRETAEWSRFRSESLEAYELSRRFKNLPVGVTERTIDMLEAGQRRMARMRQEIAAINQELDRQPGRRAQIEQERLQAQRDRAEQAELQERASAVRALSI